MKIVLAHDSFTQLGGAERVIEQLHRLYPESLVYTLVLDSKLKDQYRSWKIVTSWLQLPYRLLPRLQYLLPLIPAAVSSLDFSAYDVVLSSSSSFIRNIRVPKHAIHIDYCHTPARFLWLDEGYVGQELPVLLKPLQPILNLFLKWMQQWDYNGAQRVTHFIANSAEVQKRIKQFYNRDSTVIHPFVDTGFWHPTREKQDYFLIAGRLHAHKGNELIIQIFNELGWPLHVVGTGRQEAYLRSIAKPNITFLGRLSDEDLRDEYSGARAYVYPQFEDFGMMPLEAASCGTATLGWAKGGSLETIIPGLTGELFERQDQEQIKAHVQNWDEKKYTTEQLRQHALKFSKEVFNQKVLDFISIQVASR